MQETKRSEPMSNNITYKRNPPKGNTTKKIQLN